MPQMSPTWWLTLMMFFNLILMMTNSIIYFNYSIKKINYKKFSNKKFNWKW